MDIQTYLILGGYAFSSLIAGFMWREMYALRREVQRMREELATQRGLDEGQDHEKRISRLERLLHGRD